LVRASTAGATHDQCRNTPQLVVPSTRAL
jgi:hypothetical protein